MLVIPSGYQVLAENPKDRIKKVKKRISVYGYQRKDGVETEPILGCNFKKINGNDIKRKISNRSKY